MTTIQLPSLDVLETVLVPFLGKDELHVFSQTSKENAVITKKRLYDIREYYYIPLRYIVFDNVELPIKKIFKLKSNGDGDWNYEVDYFKWDINKDTITFREKDKEYFHTIFTESIVIKKLDNMLFLKNK